MDYGSIISLGTKPLIQPDYAKSLRDIYTELAVKIFEATNNLNQSNELNGLSGLRLSALFVDRIEWTYEITMPVWTCFALL